jgi:hypothetical protein
VVDLPFSYAERFVYEYLGGRRAYRKLSATVDRGGVLKTIAPAKADLSQKWSLGASISVGPQFYKFHEDARERMLTLGGEATLIFFGRFLLDATRRWFAELDLQVRAGIRYMRIPFCNGFAPQPGGEICGDEGTDPADWRRIPTWHFPMEVGVVAFVYQSFVWDFSIGPALGSAVLHRDEERVERRIRVLGLRTGPAIQLSPSLRLSFLYRLFRRERFVKFGSDPYGVVHLDEGKGVVRSPMIELTHENVWAF